jgi:hypothetical protein
MKRQLRERKKNRDRLGVFNRQGARGYVIDWKFLDSVG